MRPIRTAELLSVGSELTVGETRDTNAGDLARRLTAEGVEVLRMTALPDDQAAVAEAFAGGLARADLVVATGGLGPTPDDLTRESIAAALGETPTVDPDLERWLRGLFDRRGLPFPAANLKQAWRIPSATAIPNPNGTAPGWWVDAAAGGIVVALPGPPREMVPMWDGWVLPRLRSRGVGRPTAVRTLRLTGIGESLVADRLGTLLDRGANPLVATYARADAVDVRISAVAEDRDAAEAMVEAAVATVSAHLDGHVWGMGETSWGAAVAERLGAAGATLALVEAGTRGSVASLLAEALGDRLVRAVTLPDPVRGGENGAGSGQGLAALAASARQETGATIGLAVSARPRSGDTAVSVAISGAGSRRVERRIVFLDGALGRGRAATTAAAVLFEHLAGLGGAGQRARGGS